MNALPTIFTAPQGMHIRVVTIDGEPWFVAADVCRALSLDMDGGTTRHIKRLADDERKIVANVSGNFEGGPSLRTAPTAAVISESGLYRLILGAYPDRNPAVRAFQDWVTREVLPAIRKNGGYIVGQEKVRTGEMSGAELMARALIVANRTLEELTAERDGRTVVAPGRPALCSTDEQSLQPVDQPNCDPADAPRDRR